ncbi:MAG: c-type cytochrome [Bacteroidia bacterium]|nr:c-type cytochrome [Bacteroidia bacterium]
MKKVLKIVLGIFVLILLGIVTLVSYIQLTMPNVGAAPDIKIESTPELVKRGEYLANCVMVCMDCHSTRDWTKYSGPITPGTLGNGGETFNKELGFPGEFYSRNITPFGLKDWTDGEIFRAITCGVSRDGHAFFPVMPYPSYGKLDSLDIIAVIAYLRSLPSIEKQVPESKPAFPFSIILKTIPQKAQFTKKPDTSNVLAYGEYLANSANCIECHTQAEKGQIIRELAYSGGREFKMPDGSVLRTPNITPDEETGIGSWSQQAFVARFKSYVDSNYHAPAVKPGEMQSIMPWTMYGNMTEQDLKALYVYLKSLPAKKNPVVKFIAKAGA